jgi:hypothetical protein
MAGCLGRGGEGGWFRASMPSHHTLTKKLSKTSSLGFLWRFFHYVGMIGCHWPLVMTLSSIPCPLSGGQEVGLKVPALSSHLGLSVGHPIFYAN